MNKEQAIRRINKTGHVGEIITRILTILSICLGILFLFIFCMTLLIPDSYFPRIVENTTIISTVDLSPIAFDMTDEELKSLQENIYDGYTVNDQEVSDFKYEDGLITMTFDEASTNISTFKILLVSMIYGIIAIIATTISLIYLNKLCKSFRFCESPFSSDVIRCMKRFAFSLIPWAVISSISDSFFNFLSGFEDTISLTVNVSIIVVVLLILGLSYIFQYGAVLQQESDETL